MITKPESPTAQPLQTRKPGYNYAINGFRGVCVLLVFLFHLEEGSQAILKPGSLGSMATGILHSMNAFKYGVEMFFMISGYVIIGSLRKHATVKSFFVDRALRIYPAWLPLHVATFIIGPMMARGIFSDIDLAHWCLYFFSDMVFLAPVLLPFPMGFPVAWSLSYEWMFYALGGACVFLARGHLGKWKSAILTGIAAAVFINLYPRGLFFLPGVILALYEERLRAYIRFFRVPFAAMILFIMAWYGTGADKAELDTTLIEWLGDRRILFVIPAFCAGSYMFACIALGSGWLTRKLCTPMPQFLGKISYSFYLWHVIAMYPVKRLAIAYIMPIGGAWSAFAFFAVASFLLSVWVSWLSWHYIETLFTRSLKRQLELPKQPARIEAQEA